MKTRIFLKSIAVLLIGGIFMLTLSGCGAVKYRVDYGGKKHLFTGAKDAYPAGARVTLVYGYPATDTDCAFYLDGEALPFTFDEAGRITVEFTMPTRDVSLKVETKSDVSVPPETEGQPETETAEAPAPFEKTAVLEFHSFDGGGPSYTAEIADPAVLSCKTETKYNNPFHFTMKGAGYQVILTFRGRAPGKTEVTVLADSPISGKARRVYLAEVDGDLRVSLTLRSQDEGWVY